MRFCWGLGLVLVLGGVVCAADKKEQAEAIGKKMIKLMRNLAAKLGEIKDNKTADQAVPQVKKLWAQVRDLQKKAQALKLSEEEKKAFQEKFKTKLQAEATKVQAAVKKALTNAPDRAQKIKDALKSEEDAAPGSAAEEVGRKGKGSAPATRRERRAYTASPIFRTLPDVHYVFSRNYCYQSGRI